MRCLRGYLGPNANDVAAGGPSWGVFLVVLAAMRDKAVDTGRSELTYTELCGYVARRFSELWKGTTGRTVRFACRPQSAGAMRCESRAGRRSDV